MRRRSSADRRARAVPVFFPFLLPFLTFSVFFMATLVLGGCVHRWVVPEYPGIEGRVVDAETGAPIDNAVVVCVWWRQRGFPGLAYTETYKATEGLTDPQGRFRVEGVRSASPNHWPPNLTVYKRGYAAWNNKEIFPGRTKRTDFEWKDGVTIRMEKWKEGYSFVNHEGFISKCTDGASGKVATQLYEAMEWEVNSRVKERDVRYKMRQIEKGGSK